MLLPTRKPGGKQKFNVLNHITGKTKGPFTKAEAEKVEEKLQKELKAKK